MSIDYKEKYKQQGVKFWVGKDALVGESITGVFMSVEEGEQGDYAIVKADEITYGVTGKAFFPKLVEMNIEPGETIKVTFEGRVPTKKGNPMKVYKLERV